jgi:hypothetical protein
LVFVLVVASCGGTVFARKTVYLRGLPMPNETLKPCPWCNQTPWLQLTDAEGNFRTLEYLEDPYSGFSFALRHEVSDDIKCPIATGEDEILGAILYDTEAEAIAAWNKRADDWQPIATAPKDANFLAYDPNWHDESFGEEGIMALQMSRDGSLITAINRKFIDDEDYFPDGPFEPTHWKPLPTPPGGEAINEHP